MLVLGRRIVYIYLDIFSSFFLKKGLQMDISKRLRQAILLKNKTLKEFALKADIPYISLQRYLSGDRKPNTDVLSKISIHLDVNMNWLLINEGPMYRIREETAEYEKKDEIERIIGWLKDWWAQADEKKRNWLEIEIERTFPEYREWLDKQSI